MSLLYEMKNAELALYIHWPFCKSKCPYCDFNSHVREKVEQERWKKALLREMDYFAALVPHRRLRSIFFGGGTPSLMLPDTVAALIQAAKRHWLADNTLEVTLEANPTSVEAAIFREFHAAGVNRVSLGVQSLKQEDLAFLGRSHSVQEALQAVELAASIFPRYSFDLIYARPGQGLAAWEEELRQALHYARGHLSLYQLTIEENTAFYHAYHGKKQFILPTDVDAAALYICTQEIMEAAGMPAYEVSNHAASGQESAHNLAYWKGLEYVGIGPGAHGRIGCANTSGLRKATQTIKSPERWLEQVEQHGQGAESITILTDQERLEEWLMMRLRLIEPVAFTEIPAGVNVKRLPFLAEQERITLAKESFAITLKGRLVLNALVDLLLA